MDICVDWCERERECERVRECRQINRLKFIYVIHVFLIETALKCTPTTNISSDTNIINQMDTGRLVLQMQIFIPRNSS